MSFETLALPRIAIIGGGPGGLMTAHRLQQSCGTPHAITLFEGSARLGGKVRTESFTKAPVSYEGGAAELYDYSHLGTDPLRELILSLDLQVQPMQGRAVQQDGVIYADMHAFAAASGEATRRALCAFDARARAWMSPQDYYASDWTDDSEDDLMQAHTFAEQLDLVKDARARRYLETLVHSDLATEPHRTSAAYGLQNYLMNEPDYMRLYTIEGGIEQLTLALAAQMRGQVRLNRRVERVEQLPGGTLRVSSREFGDCAGQTFQEDFDYVIAALPNCHLEAIDWRGELAAPMRRHHAHFDHPAHYLRVSLLFREVFWREQLHDSYIMLESFGGCCLYDESSRNGCADYGALGWLLAGEAAMTLANQPDAAIVERVLASLPPFLQQGAPLLVEARVHRWVGEVNGLPGGRFALPVETRHVPAAGAPNLCVVGDYLFDSTLNGVLDSADFVAEHLTELLQKRSAAPLGAAGGAAR